MMTRRRFLGAIAAAPLAAESAARAFTGGDAAGASLAAATVAHAFTGGAGVTRALRPRKVAAVAAPRADQVGDVFKVRRTVPAANVDQVSPWILLDHFDFTIARGQLGGLAPHPHRGLETVTVLLEGAIEHGDSTGMRAVLQSGDVQWMTAGAGIVHEENPADVLRERGGRVLGLQLWVNLPRALKSTPPKYQDTAAARIPVDAEAGVTARVIAGEANGVSAVIGTHTPMTLVDYTLGPGSEVVLAYPPGWTAFLHVVVGLIEVGDTRVGEAHLALLGRDGSGIQFRNVGSRQARVVLGGGQPIDEPLVRYGPFAMNTHAEIRQAFDDYRAGRMGRVANPTYDRVRAR